MLHKITIIDTYVNLSYNINVEKSKYFYPADYKKSSVGTLDFLHYHNFLLYKKNAPSCDSEYVSVLKPPPPQYDC